MADTDNREHSLVFFASQAQDAAAALVSFGRSLPPSSATGVAALVSELFACSSVLHYIHVQEGTRHYGPSFYRIHDDLELLFRTFKLTLDEVFGMFARSRDRAPQMIWEDLHHTMERVEGCRLQVRLELYREFLDAQSAVLEGRGAQNPRELRQDLRDLLEAQERTTQRRMRRVSASGASTPRPRLPQRPAIHRLSTPSTPTIISDEWDAYTAINRPPVPEAPISQLSPLSQTFTSNSSQSMSSSQTSYSSDPYYSTTSSNTLIHWAQNVFDGSPLTTQYNRSTQLHDRSVCYGPVDLSSLPNLSRDSFQRVLQLPFDQESLWVRLYWRASDHRARILIMTQDSAGQHLYYCTPLTNLKIMRQGSCLQLCRARRGDSHYSLWARLNFLFHERMVLFYSTFIAMKRQDIKPIPHPTLLDEFELEDEGGEQELFAGEVSHDNMLNALRLFRDRGSGVVRLEASPRRGPKKDVPIWTAFVTKYANDPDWVQDEGHAIVSVAAIRPPPTVFIARYEPPKTSRHYILPFTTGEDAQTFMETWRMLCNTHGRRL